MAIIDELISRLGFELDGKEDLREFKRGMNDAEKGAKGFATSVTQMARNVTMGIGASIAAVKGLTAGMFAMANAATGRSMNWSRRRIARASVSRRFRSWASQPSNPARPLVR